MQVNFSKPILGLGVCLVLASSFSCGKKSSDKAATAETSIKLTGTLALEGQATTLGLLANPALTDLSMYCVSLSVPPVAGTGAIDADGKFAVTLDTSGVSVGCFILDAAKAILGTMVFEDSATKDLNGDAKASDKFALVGGESNLGAIKLNLSTGKAVVDVAKIVGKAKDTTAVLTGAYDFTGNYKFQASGQDAPSGYANLCTREEQEASHGSNGKPAAGAKKCDGPSLDMPIYMKRIKGVAAGTTTPRYAMAFWASKAADVGCGSKLGVTFADAKAHGIDLSASGVGEGEFTWAAGFEDGWKDTANATVKYPLMKQERVDNFKGFPGNKQYFKQYRTFTCIPGSPCTDGTPVAATGFMFNADTNDAGCKNAAGKGVQLNDWKDMKCTPTTVGEGLRKNVCTKTVNGEELTCTNIGGTFTLAGVEIQNAMVRFPEDFDVLAIAGQKCSTIAVTTAEGKLAQLRCYAEANRGGGGESGEDMSVCKREVRTNWNAKTPLEFVSGGKSKPKAQFVFELLDYDTATSASLRGEERDYRGIRVGDNFTDCEIASVFSFSMKKIDNSNDLLGEMVQTETNVSTKPACIAEFPADKPTKYLFKLVKQAD
ncbi:MAG: hypothetical protein H7318_19600 [Oligoflexus sp.]|nr:hypothetical protein [Oligoflexus sp.]